MLYLSLRFVHIIFMAAWFGAPLFIASDIRRTLAAGPAGLPLLERRVGRSNMVAAIGAVGTILTGFGLIFALGGFGKVPPPIHAGLLLGVIMLLLGGGGIDRTCKQIFKQLGEGASPESLGRLTKRLSMLSGIFQLLWLVTLVLMVFRNSLF